MIAGMADDFATSQVGDGAGQVELDLPAALVAQRPGGIADVVARQQRHPVVRVSDVDPPQPDASAMPN